MKFSPILRRCQFCKQVYEYINAEDLHGCPDCRVPSKKNPKLKLLRRPMGDVVEFTDEEMAQIPRVKMVRAEPVCAICDEPDHAAPDCSGRGRPKGWHRDEKKERE